MRSVNVDAQLVACSAMHLCQQYVELFFCIQVKKFLKFMCTEVSK